MENLLKIASQFRQEYRDTHPFMLTEGFVLIYDENAYGWRNEVRHPQTERPGSYLVGLTLDEIYVAQGGSNLIGAKKWVNINQNR